MSVATEVNAAAFIAARNSAWVGLLGNVESFTCTTITEGAPFSKAIDPAIASLFELDGKPISAYIESGEKNRFAIL
jgi:hypothetical protein